MFKKYYEKANSMLVLICVQYFICGLSVYRDYLKFYFPPYSYFNPL